MIAIEQEHIVVALDFYNDQEKAKLLAYPTAPKIVHVVKHGLKIPTPEFLTYFLFHRKRPGVPGYRRYQDIQQKIGIALSMLDEFVNFNGQSIDWPKEAINQIGYVTEYIGESIGLAAINRIHGLTQADWVKITEIHGPNAPPVFDYEQLATDGENLIQLETKGSSVKDNSQLTDVIRAHKANITKKKRRIAELKTQYPYPSSIRYGTITAVSAQPGSTLKCWLLDPDPEPLATNPRNLRLLNRMRFLRDWISFISARSQLAAALATRIADLEAMANPFELDTVPLRKGNNNPFHFEIFTTATQRHSTFFSNKSRVKDGPAGGVLLQTSDTALFFLGIREELLSLACEQVFGSILDYKADVGSILKRVECVLSQGRFKRFKLPASVRNSVRVSGPYLAFDLTGQLHYTREGLVVGVLPLPRE
jgi:hypothetical protein